MKTSDFYYDLPNELIAQTPVYPRDSSRLLVYDKAQDRVDHKIFRNIEELLTDNSEVSLQPELSHVQWPASTMAERAL